MAQVSTYHLHLTNLTIKVRVVGHSFQQLQEISNSLKTSWKAKFVSVISTTITDIYFQRIAHFCRMITTYAPHIPFLKLLSQSTTLDDIKQQKCIFFLEIVRPTWDYLLTIFHVLFSFWLLTTLWPETGSFHLSLSSYSILSHTLTLPNTHRFSGSGSHSKNLILTFLHFLRHLS